MKRFNVLLWVVQGLLAAVFLFAGGIKLVLPLEALSAGPVPLPGLFMRFIGVAEVLGACGLILPGLLRIMPFLTPLAAGGLTVIMVGATVITLIGGDLVPALVPVVVGSLAILVAYGRTRSRVGRRSWRGGHRKATPLDAVA
jgi:hypothetical protein